MTDVIAGRFALCDPIARGSSGVVWRAYDRKLQRFCAAKVLRRRDAGELLRFVREQSVRVAHPHVLTPYSWAAEDTHVVIASELVDGGSLATLIGDYGALDADTVAVLLDQLLDALEHVHAAGIVHRDVKPANLLLRATGTDRPHLMLSDFGIAMGADDAHLTQAGTIVGTPAYLAPELLAGGLAPDPRQDLYAAGRVAVALLIGDQPRDAGAVPVPAAPAALRDLAIALTAPLPRDRPPSAAAARRALRPALDGSGLPRTAGGEPVDVLHQLPPLSDETLSAADEAAGGAADGAADGAAGGAVDGDTAAVAELAPSTTTLPPHPHRRRVRRRWLYGIAAAALATAIGVPVALATIDTSPGGHPPPPRSSTPKQHSSSPAAPVSTRATPAGVRVGGACSWQQEGDRAATSDGTAVVCRNRNGAYLWIRS